MKNVLMAVVMLTAGAVWADVPPSDTQGCLQKARGDACQTDASKAGACQAQTCSRLDYSDGSPPGTITYACLVCVAGASPSASVDAGSGGTATPVKTGCTVGFGLALPAAALLLGLRRRRR